MSSDNSTSQKAQKSQKAVKDRTISVQEKSEQKIEKKKADIQQKRSAKLDEKRKEKAKDEVPRVSQIQINIKYNKPAPKLKLKQKTTLTDEELSTLYERMKQYASKLEEQSVKSQIDLHRKMGRSIEESTFERRIFRLDDKMYGRKKKYCMIVQDEPR